MSEPEPEAVQPDRLDRAQSLPRNVIFWRAVAMAVVATPIMATVIVGYKLLALVPLCIALVGLLSGVLRWPPLLWVVVLSLAGWSAIAPVLHGDPTADTFLVFGLFGLMCLGIFFGLALLGSRELRGKARERLSPLWRGVREKMPETPESLAAKGISIHAQTTVRDTDAGPEYTVTWTDSAMLRFHHKGNVWLALSFAAVFMLLLGFNSRGTASGDRFTFFGVVLSIAAVWRWAYEKHHERYRYAARSVVFRPDGSIAINNPPSGNPERETDGPSFVIPNGLRRLVSIEYGRTADWFSLRKEYVFEPIEWYEVSMLIDTGGRVSVSRNLGFRQHAHQVAGELNELKARLTSLQSQRPKVERIID